MRYTPEYQEKFDKSLCKKCSQFIQLTQFCGGFDDFITDPDFLAKDICSEFEDKIKI